MKKLLLGLPLYLFIAGTVGINGDSSLMAAPRDATQMGYFRGVPDSCYFAEQRPSITRCSYYRECLEASITCEGTNYPYAISYGEKYCNKFSSLRESMSDLGKTWIDGAMICLQSNIPFIGNRKNSFSMRGGEWPATDVSRGEFGYGYNSCQNIRKIEFESHPNCYLGGDARFYKSSHPSICVLSLEEWARIFVKLEPTDLDSKEAFVQMGVVAAACIKYELSKFQRSGFSNEANVIEPSLFQSVTASSENSKRIDFWTWKQQSWSNASRGLPRPPPPDSIKEEVYKYQEHGNIQPYSVSIWADDGSKFYAENRGGGRITAAVVDTARARNETIFYLVDLNREELENGDHVNIKTRNQWFFRADNGGGAGLSAGSLNAGTSISSFEEFVIEKVTPGDSIIRSRDKIRLRAIKSWNYVLAENGGNSVVNVNRVTPGIWETFTLDFNPPGS